MRWIPSAASLRSVPVFLCLLTSACGILAPEDRWERLERQLEQNWRRWDRQGIEAYSFVQVSICECLPSFAGPVRIRVEEGVITHVERSLTGEAVEGGIWDQWRTLDGLFAEIANAIDWRVAYLDVDYDPGRGFPVRVEVDRSAQTADDEMVIQVSDFRVEVPW